ncbi:hypothetical protein ABT79_06640 [Salmonella enterica subsp. enterica serovar Typhimurium]|nr:hypothetical protein ABT79_06640 [Salmonella enterica subsp. enterica serovar Typhimurium]
MLHVFAGTKGNKRHVDAVITPKRLTDNLLTFAIDQANTQNVPFWCAVPLSWTRAMKTLAGEPFKNIPDHLRPLTSERFSVILIRLASAAASLMRSYRRVAMLMTIKNRMSAVVADINSRTPIPAPAL